MAKDMTEGSPARLILFFALPLIAGNMVQQMYAFVDTFLVGRFLGVKALAAVGCTGCLMFLLIGFVMGMTTGLAIKTGQAFGAKDEVGVRRSAAACVVLSLIMAAGLVVFGLPLIRPVLTVLDKRKKNISATIYTQQIKKQLSLDIAKHNAQYQPIEIKEFDKIHDRFLCIDSVVYHIGASLKDLGKKWFAFTKMEITTETLLKKV